MGSSPCEGVTTVAQKNGEDGSEAEVGGCEEDDSGWEPEVVDPLPGNTWADSGIFILMYVTTSLFP